MSVPSENIDNPTCQSKDSDFLGSKVPAVGAKISILTLNDMRYEGVVLKINSNECTILLGSVRSCGTEDRRVMAPVAPLTSLLPTLRFPEKNIKNIDLISIPADFPTEPSKPTSNPIPEEISPLTTATRATQTTSSYLVQQKFYQQQLQQKLFQQQQQIFQDLYKRHWMSSPQAAFLPTSCMSQKAEIQEAIKHVRLTSQGQQAVKNVAKRFVEDTKKCECASLPSQIFKMKQEPVVPPINPNEHIRPSCQMTTHSDADNTKSFKYHSSSRKLVFEEDSDMDSSNSKPDLLQDIPEEIDEDDFELEWPCPLNMEFQPEYAGATGFMANPPLFTKRFNGDLKEEPTDRRDDIVDQPMTKKGGTSAAGEACGQSKRTYLPPKSTYYATHGNSLFAKRTDKFQDDFDFEEANNAFQELMLNDEVHGDMAAYTESVPGFERTTNKGGYDKTMSFYDTISYEARDENKENIGATSRSINKRRDRFNNQ